MTAGDARGARQYLNVMKFYNLTMLICFHSGMIEEAAGYLRTRYLLGVHFASDEGIETAIPCVPLTPNLTPNAWNQPRDSEIKIK